MKYLIIISVFFMACDPIKEQYIQPELIDHYNQFYIEAELRGVYPSQKEIHLSLGDPGNNKNGVAKGRGKDWCKIIISQEYYDRNKDRCLPCIERLVFHEMGHGILNRPHLNDERDSVVHIYAILNLDTLSHAEISISIPLSIMHDGDNSASPYYEKNREYYLNELFR